MLDGFPVRTTPMPEENTNGDSVKALNIPDEN